jgi:chaperonin GroEL (HSP60 family)
MEVFEYYRYKSVLLGKPDEMNVIMRSEELEQQAKQAESILDAEILRERLAILTGGIARLKVKGSSEAELKEKRHRVEDAVAAIKGAIKYGVLPGCAKTLATLANIIHSSNAVSQDIKAIMPSAFSAPFERILSNGGLNHEEISKIAMDINYTIQEHVLQEEVVETNRWKRLCNKLLGKPNKHLKDRTIKVAYPKEFWHTYDALNHTYGHGIEIGVIDSAAAVMMSIKNSLSVAKMLMGLSGVVVFKRDNELDREEANSYRSEEAAIKEALNDEENRKWEIPI